MKGRRRSPQAAVGQPAPVVVAPRARVADEPQKNGKTIRWCQVDVGEHNVGGADLGGGGGTPRGIVCGAHNFVAGDAVVVALPGAVLAGGFAISARKTYGHVSDGMICSARELGSATTTPGSSGSPSSATATPSRARTPIGLLGLDEEVVEINVTPDRGYALSIRGVAREYALSTGTAFADPAAVEVPAPTADGFGCGSRTPRRSAATAAATGSSRAVVRGRPRRATPRSWRAGWAGRHATDLARGRRHRTT
jgi:phenylalanyl-tRNA synthetase beta chain